MRVLLVGDLHEVEVRYRWLATAAESFDLVSIAGDILQIFQNAPWSTKVADRIGPLREVARRAPLAVCEGNHDTGRMTGLFGTWAAEAPHPVLVSPGSRIFQARSGGGGLVVTAFPYQASPTINALLWGEGAAERERSGLPWLVLHHIPPFGVPGDGGKGCRECLEAIRYFQPDFVHSGHIHTLPYPPLGAFAGRVGRTWCLNAGQDEGLLPSPIPNHIMLDTDLGTTEWFATTDEGVELRQLCSLHQA